MNNKFKKFESDDVPLSGAKTMQLLRVILLLRRYYSSVLLLIVNFRQPYSTLTLSHRNIQHTAFNFLNLWIQ